MTKRKGAAAGETMNRLLSAAQTIFLQCGYKDASLRQICQKANVTTGALYCFYRDKDALFEALMRPFAEALFQILTDHFHAEVHSRAEEDAVSRDFISRFIDFREENRELCGIFFANPEHPYCIEIQKELVDLFSGQTKALLKRVNDEHITHCVFNEDTILWFSHIQVDMHLQVLRHPFSKEQATEQMRIYARFLKGGFLELVSPRFPEDDPTQPD